MARLTGPAHSLDAHGSLQRLLEFVRTQRGHAAKTKSRPRDPRTAKQVNIRAVMRYLQQRWTGLSDAQKASWDPYRAAYNLPRYHAYLRYNLERWAHHKAPSMAWPATEATIVTHRPIADGDTLVRAIRWGPYRYQTPADNAVILSCRPWTAGPIGWNDIYRVLWHTTAAMNKDWYDPGAWGIPYRVRLWAIYDDGSQDPTPDDGVVTPTP